MLFSSFGVALRANRCAPLGYRATMATADSLTHVTSQDYDYCRTQKSSQLYYRR